MSSSVSPKLLSNFIGLFVCFAQLAVPMLADAQKAKPQPTAKSKVVAAQGARKGVTPTATASATVVPQVEAIPQLDLPNRFEGFETVLKAARELVAKGAAGEQHARVPQEWREISYPEFQSIRFRPEKAIWRSESDYEVQLFHAGFLYETPIQLEIVEDEQIKPFDFKKEYFSYDKERLQTLPTDGLGYSGFRVHYPLHGSNYRDEFLVFLGASYFKILGRNQQYGLSARGLAINTALPQGEEFPWFSRFWIRKPSKDSTAIEIYALLESKSVVGAYEFKADPGTSSAVDVRAVLYFREAVEKLGLAPLTSMYLYGENSVNKFDDFRPEIHDSDGLLMKTGQGEWIWRPLQNFKALNISAFSDNNPKGFGLLQRDQQFDSYQDLEALYHRRPSYWVEPKNDWGQGHVELVEIPTDSETNDNVVAYWVPAKVPAAGDSLELSYRLSAIRVGQPLGDGARVTSTRVGAGRPLSGKFERDPDIKLFVVEFNGGDLPWLLADQPVSGVVTASHGELHNITVQRNQESRGWRLFFELDPQGHESVELRAFLKLRDDVLSETWSNLWKPS